MAEKTMSFRRDGRLLVIVHGACSPSDLEWATFLKEMQTIATTQELRVVTYSYGGGPDGRQRKAATDLNKGGDKNRNIVVALLTASTVMRAMSAALSWFIRNLKVFGLDADAEAAKFLGLTPDEAKRVGAYRRELERELGIARAVESSMP